VALKPTKPGAEKETTQLVYVEW